LPLEKPPIDFNLDFHAIPFRGTKNDLEKHWVPKSHRGQPAVMAFVAQEESRRVMVYATANVLRQDADNMVVKFVDHWKELTGHYPKRSRRRRWSLSVVNNPGVSPRTRLDPSFGRTDP